MIYKVPTKTHGYYVKKTDIITITQNITTRGPYGSHAVMLESDQLLFLTR